MNRGLSIGGVTILVVFIILCLSIFSVASVSYANADLTFSKRLISSVNEYYNADAKAQNIICEIHDIIVSGDNNYSKIENVDLEISGNIVSFNLPVSNYINLYVEVDTEPENSQNPYEIIKYKEIPNNDIEDYKHDLNLWNGSFEVEQ